MKYCKKCGFEMEDDSAFCSYCGERDSESGENIKEEPESEQHSVKDDENDDTQNTIGTLIKVFSVLTTVLAGFYLIALLWMVPMCRRAFKTVDQKKPFTTGFAVLSILFLSTVSGILMLFYRRKN